MMKNYSQLDPEGSLLTFLLSAPIQLDSAVLCPAAHTTAQVLSLTYKCGLVFQICPPLPFKKLSLDSNSLFHPPIPTGKKNETSFREKV